MLGTALVYIGIPAAIVIAWQRVWVGVPLLVWALTAFGVPALLDPFVGAACGAARDDKRVCGRCRMAGLFDAAPAATGP